jgi:hypothetical protein
MPDLQGVFREYGNAFRQNNYISPEQQKAIDAILSCRTEILGAHIDQCDECGHLQISYNSCRNRHCPKCQTFAKEDWIDRQRGNLLDIQYFHIVFTIPSELNPTFMQNQDRLYGLLFKAASESIIELCADKKYLGATPGLTTILHTWGQNLHYHPHIHCIVTGGGLNSIGNWVNSGKKFFLPVKVLSRKFRGKFMSLFKSENLEFFGQEVYLAESNNFDAFISELYRKEWVVYCKETFKCAAKVLDYFGRYTHRVAISNERIIGIENGYIAFRWRDYSDGNKTKLMKLLANEFIRRFLNHVLPLGFRKIRHYGLLAPRNKNKRIILCRRLTGTRFVVKIETTYEKLIRIFGKDFDLCPHCKKGHLRKPPPSTALMNTAI